MTCLDSSFIIDILRGEKKADNIIKELDNKSEQISLTSITIMEIVKGAYLSINSEKELENINKLLSSLIVLDFDKESAFLAGKIDFKLRSEGNIIQIEDIMIAAIAIKNNEVLITRNVKHFAKIPKLKIWEY